MQNLVLLIGPELLGPESRKCETSLKTGNMCINRFCIDEDAAFELSGVYDIQSSSNRITDKIRRAIRTKGKVNNLYLHQKLKSLNNLFHDL